VPGSSRLRKSAGRVLLEYDEMEGIAWEWQSLDGAMVKVPLALETVGKFRRIVEKTALSEVSSDKETL